MANPAGLLVPPLFYKDLLKMHSEWRRKPKNQPPQWGRWPVGGASSQWLGVLNADLGYHSSAEVAIYTWDESAGHFTDSEDTATCYPWLMLSGDSIPSGTQVVGCFVGGKRVVFDCACDTGT